LAKRSKRKTWFPGGMRRRWKDPDGTIYEWDYENGRVEIYGRRGEPHRGEYDPVTGKQTKPPDPTRVYEPVPGTDTLFTAALQCKFRSFRQAASESAGAEADDPRGQLRYPAELIERDAEQERARNAAPKPMQEYNPIVAPLCWGVATARSPK
jgi:Cytotoxic